jgi:hypothetical protein
MLPYDVSIKYMLAGYAVIFITLAIYLVSLLARWKKLRRDLNALRQIERK